MLRKHGPWLAILLLAAPLWAELNVSTNTTSIETPAPPDTTLSEETENKGIIPTDGLNSPSTTGPVTPTSVFPEKKPYDQARDELIRAHDLWDKGHAEAASDTALEAYDDFIDLRRVPGVKRTVIREQAHQAARIYVEAGIAYIKKYVQRMGDTPEAREEGRARMEDLRDVARNYPELNKMLNQGIGSLYSPTTVNPADKK